MITPERLDHMEAKGRCRFGPGYELGQGDLLDLIEEVRRLKSAQSSWAGAVEHAEDAMRASDQAAAEWQMQAQVSEREVVRLTEWLVAIDRDLGYCCAIPDDEDVATRTKPVPVVEDYVSRALAGEDAP